MRWLASFIITAAVLAMGAPQAIARTYYVSQQGSDAHDGASETTSFKTIQKGVDALEAGDTLIIGPGEYRENVYRENLGNAQKDTLIRAQIRGTVLLRGDVPAPRFTKAKGFRFVYVADFDGDAQVVNEVDTLRMLEPVPHVAVLDFTAGCFYDASNRKLYISSSDLQPPSQHHYTVSVNTGHGLHLHKPVRVIVDGIASAGHNSAAPLVQDAKHPGYRAAWGILLAHAKESTIRHCTAYFNGGGIALDPTVYDTDAGGNRIEHCVAFANFTRHSGEGGNILAFSANNDTIAHSYAHSSLMQGIRLYGNITGPAVARHNLAWGNEAADIWIKGGQAIRHGVVENSIALGDLHVMQGHGNLLSGRHKYARELWPDSINLLNEPRLDRAAEFADPDNLDFRLQATSRFRSRSENNTDRGPLPYKPNIYYVKADGDDQANGLSIAHAWQTLDHALENIKAGDTLYLEAGTYHASRPWRVAGSQKQPVSIRGRGIEPVIIQSPVNITRSSHLQIERLTFTQRVSINQSHELRLNNCRFLSEESGLQATDVDALRISQSIFVGFKTAGVMLKRCSDVAMLGNIHDNRHGPAVVADDVNAIRYSNYNSYENDQQAWRVGGAAMSLSQVTQGALQHDRQSLQITPQWRSENGLAVLENPQAFVGRGPLGRGLGVYHEFRRRDMRLQGPMIHSVTDTTANIEWWSSVPAEFEIAWGDTPACENRRKLTTDRYASISLNDLQPGKTYYFKVLSARPSRYFDAVVTRGIARESAPLSFETPAQPSQAMVYYVAPDGDDENTGLSREQAWRNVRHAADRANAGDTVLISEGTYHETIWLRATGTPGRPITFKAAPGEKVVFDGNRRSILTAFELVNKHHIHLDGLYFIHYGRHHGEGGVIALNDSHHVSITRCFLNGKGPGYPNPFIHAQNADGLLVSNCVVVGAFNGMNIHGAGKVTIENNVFVQNMIMAANFTTHDVTFQQNIVLDSKASKVKVVLLCAPRSALEHFTLRHNAFYLRVPDEERTPILFYRDGASFRPGSPDRFSVAGYDQYKEQHSNMVIYPLFQIVREKADPTTADAPSVYMGDWIFSQCDDFDDLFTSTPALNERRIGLIQGDFTDFHFNTNRTSAAR